MRRSSLLVLYVTVFIDLLGFGIILPLLPYYAERFGAGGLGVGALVTAYSAAQFLGAPLLGRLSDRFGRRPLLLASLLGSALSLALSGFADSLAVLVAARALAGLFGGSIATAQAYVADVTRPEERAKYLGLLGASIGMGFVFGPALGSGLSRFGFGTAAFVAAGLAAANLVFAAFRLEEPAATAGAASRRRVDAGALRTALGSPTIGRVVAATFIAMLAFVAMETTFALLGERRFGLDQGKLGFVFTYLGLLVAAVQGGLVGRLAPRVGERNLALGGTLLMALSLSALPFMPGLLSALVALGLLAVGQALTLPTLTALLSRASTPEEQGGTLGLGQSVSALARALGPVAAGALFDRSAALPYVAGGAALLLGAGLVASLRAPPADGPALAGPEVDPARP